MCGASSRRLGQNVRVPDQPPAFQFYAKDWLASSAVRRMNLAERGAYIDLLAHAWNDGAIPNDAESLSSMLGVSKRVWKTVAPKVLSRFTDKGDGTLVNEKQEGVRDQLLAWKEGQSKAGKAGAKKRWGRHVSASGVATVSPLAKNSSASATAVRTAPPRLQSEGGSAVPPAESAPQSPAPSGATPDTTPLSPEEAKKRWGEIKTKVLGDIEKRKAERAAGNGQIVEGDGKPIDWSQFPNASPLDGAPPEEPPATKDDDGPTYDARPSADFNEGGDP